MLGRRGAGAFAALVGWAWAVNNVRAVTAAPITNRFHAWPHQTIFLILAQFCRTRTTPSNQIPVMAGVVFGLRISMSGKRLACLEKHRMLEYVAVPGVKFDWTNFDIKQIEKD